MHCSFPHSEICVNGIQWDLSRLVQASVLNTPCREYIHHLRISGRLFQFYSVFFCFSYAGREKKVIKAVFPGFFLPMKTKAWGRQNYVKKKKKVKDLKESSKANNIRCS